MSTPAFVQMFQPNALQRRCILLALVMGPGLTRTPWAQAQETSPAEAPLISVQLANTWPATRSPQGFRVSEKLDGVRAVWDGQVLRFRSGRRMVAPTWFVSALPALALDGELWMARGAFDRLSGVLRQSVPNDAAWREVQYWIFDSPGHSGTFTERVAFVESSLAAAQVPWLKPVAHQAVNDAKALQTLLKATVRQGGEGLMLHRSDALWLPGRTDALFKLKPEWDEEGLVVGHLAGKGRLKGQTGALWVQMPSGQRFALGAGLSDVQRRDPPPVGSWVTYRFPERTPSGLPRFASFVRVREAE
jgi:DNA ligase 1